MSLRVEDAPLKAEAISSGRDIVTWMSETMRVEPVVLVNISGGRDIVTWMSETMRVEPVVLVNISGGRDIVTWMSETMRVEPVVLVNISGGRDIVTWMSETMRVEPVVLVNMPLCARTKESPRLLMSDNVNFFCKRKKSTLVITNPYGKYRLFVVKACHPHGFAGAPVHHWEFENAQRLRPDF
jgi:isopentenyl phosphate kinase